MWSCEIEKKKIIINKKKEKSDKICFYCRSRLNAMLLMFWNIFVAVLFVWMYVSKKNVEDTMRKHIISYFAGMTLKMVLKIWKKKNMTKSQNMLKAHLSKSSSLISLYYILFSALSVPSHFTHSLSLSFHVTYNLY